MRKELLSKFSDDGIFYHEFIMHYNRLDNETISLIYNDFLSEMKEITGLYTFARFWYKKILNWSGNLNEELVYLAIKALVLAGLNKEARIIGRGYNFHLGCLSWILGSYFRENTQTVEFKDLLNELKYKINNNSFIDIAFNDAIAWLMAYVPIEVSIDLYNKNKSKFSNFLPLYVLLEKLIKENNLKLCFEYLKDHSNKRNLKNTNILDNLILNKEAVLYQLTGNQDKAIFNFEIVSQRATEIGDIVSVAKVNYNLGSSYFYQSNFDVAQSYWLKAKLIYEKIGDELGLAKVFHNISTIYNAQGEFLKSENFLMRAKKIYDKTQSTMRIPISIKIADLLKTKGKYSESMNICNRYFTDSPTILNYEIKFKLALIQEEIGNYDLAEKEINFAVRIAKDIGYELGEIYGLIFHAKIILKRGEIIKAKEMLDDAYKRNFSIKNERGQVITLELLGYCFLFEGKLIEAESHIRTALEFARNLKIFTEEISCQHILSLILFFQNQDEKALNIIENLFYVLKKKGIRNSIYFSTLLLKIKINLFAESNRHSIQLDIFELINSSKNSGSKYWERLGRILEIEELFNNNEAIEADKRLKEIRVEEKLKGNFETFHLTNILLLKSKLIKLKNNSVIDPNILTNELLSEIENLRSNNSFIYLVEYSLLLIQLYANINCLELAYIEYDSILSICQNYGLSFFINRLKIIKNKCFLEKDPNYKFSNKSNEVLLLIPRN